MNARVATGSGCGVCLGFSVQICVSNDEQRLRGGGDTISGVGEWDARDVWVV